MKIETSITINAPVEKVFKAFTDLTLAEKTLSGIETIEVLEGNPIMEVGTKWRETRIMFGKEASETMEVTRLEQNVMYQVEAESHGTHYTSIFTFTEQNGETEVKLEFLGKALSVASRIFSVMLFFFKGPTRKALHKDLEDLKQAIEK